MRIDYLRFLNYILINIKTYIIFELVFLGISLSYFIATPKIYESYFELTATKIFNNKGYWQSITPGIDIKRGLQNPSEFSTYLISECMGEDSNSNRKLLVNALRIELIQGGERIGIALRLNGKDKTKKCANLILNTSITNLNETLNVVVNSLLINDDIQKTPELNVNFIQKAAIAIPVRMSDSYVKPDLLKLLLLGVVTGLFAAFFYIQLKAKYGEQ